MDGRTWLFATLALYGASTLAFVVAALRGTRDPVGRPSRRFAIALACLGVALGANVVALVVRAEEAGHAPFQTLYETFLLAPACLAAGFLAILAISRGGATALGARRLLSWVGALGALAATGTLSHAATIDDATLPLPPALQSGWFVPHVVVYFFGYGAGILAFLAALLTLVLRLRPGLAARVGPVWAGAAPGFLDRLVFRMVALGFPFLTAGLVFGALWAEDAWGTYWGWDTKEVWALLTWSGYLVYLHLRRIPGFAGGPSTWTVLACGLIVIVTYQFFGYLPASVASLHNYAGLDVPGATP